MFKAWVTTRGRVVCALGQEVLGTYRESSVTKSMLDMEVLYTYEGTYDINSLLAGSQLTGIKAFT
jgi:acyl-CoA oxidase